MAEMLELYDKDLKAVMVQMLQWVITNSIETHEKVQSLSKEIGSLSKEKEDTEKNQMEMVELKIW